MRLGDREYEWFLCLFTEAWRFTDITCDVICGGAIKRPWFGWYWTASDEEGWCLGLRQAKRRVEACLRSKVEVGP